MAGADYRSCDHCGGKAFYDADLDYELSASPRGKIIPEGSGDLLTLCSHCVGSGAAGLALVPLRDVSHCWACGDKSDPLYWRGADRVCRGCAEREG